VVAAETGAALRSLLASLYPGVVDMPTSDEDESPDFITLTLAR
jgi:hypothetical protein